MVKFIIYVLVALKFIEISAVNSMENNIIKIKSYNFAVRVVNAYKHISNKNKEYVLSKQLLRSGTSIGANVSESISAQSKKDFKHKINIALKEARETEYWLRLLFDTQYLNKEQFDSLYTDLDEILRLLVKISKNTYIE